MRDRNCTDRGTVKITTNQLWEGCRRLLISTYIPGLLRPAVAGCCCARGATADGRCCWVVCRVCHTPPPEEMEAPKTRLIVKNVPKHIDEKRLWQHFAERGEVSLLRLEEEHGPPTNKHTNHTGHVRARSEGGSICWTPWRAQAADLYNAVSECYLLAVGPYVLLISSSLHLCSRPLQC